MSRPSRRTVLTLLPVTVLSVVAGCGVVADLGSARTTPLQNLAGASSTESGLQIPESAGSQTIAGIADFPIYGTVPELVKSSSVAAVGQVVDIGASWQEEDLPGTPENKKGTGRLIFTPVSVEVEKVLAYRNGPEPGSSILLTQDGGVVNGRESTVGGSPTYALGERLLLFLGWFDVSGDGSYGAMGGNQGFYTLSNANVLSAPSGSAEGNVTAELDGLTLEEAEQVIAAANR